MEVDIISRDVCTFAELEVGDIFSYPHSNILYMKIREGEKTKMVHIPSGVVQISQTPGSDQELVKRNGKLTIYESYV